MIPISHTEQSNLTEPLVCSGTLWKGNELIEGVLEVLDLLRQLVSTFDTTRQLLGHEASAAHAATLISEHAIEYSIQLSYICCTLQVRR